VDEELDEADRIGHLESLPELFTSREKSYPVMTTSLLRIG